MSIVVTTPTVDADRLVLRAPRIRDTAFVAFCGAVRSSGTSAPGKPVVCANLPATGFGKPESDRRPA